MHVASHQSVERPQQEVWLYLCQMELWKGLGSFDLLQFIHSVNGDGSKAAKIIQTMITNRHIA